MKNLFQTSKVRYLRLFPIYLLQKPIGIDLKLYGLMPIIGLITLIRRRKFEVEFTIFNLLFLCSILRSLHDGDFLSLRRSFQTLLMTGFCSYLINYFTNKELNQLAKNSVWMIIIYYLFEYAIGARTNVILFHLWPVDYFTSGILNNSNYTGLLSSGLALFFFLTGSNFYFFVALLLVALSASKTALFTLLLACPIFFRISTSKYISIYTIFVLGVIFLFPLLIIIFESVSNEEIKFFVNSISGGRYIIQLSFLELVKANLFGVGYDKSHELISDYIYIGSTLVTNQLISPHYSNIGPHSTYIKILAELGIFGYIGYFVFLTILLKCALHFDTRLAICFVAICGAQLWLEGLSEFIFYFFIAIILRYKYFQKGETFVIN